MFLFPVMMLVIFTSGMNRMKLSGNGERKSHPPYRVDPSMKKLATKIAHEYSLDLQNIPAQNTVRIVPHDFGGYRFKSQKSIDKFSQNYETSAIKQKLDPLLTRYESKLQRLNNNLMMMHPSRTERKSIGNEISTNKGKIVAVAVLGRHAYWNKERTPNTCDCSCPDVAYSCEKCPGIFCDDCIDNCNIGKAQCDSCMNSCCRAEYWIKCKYDPKCVCIPDCKISEECNDCLGITECLNGCGILSGGTAYGASVFPQAFAIGGGGCCCCTTACCCWWRVSKHSPRFHFASKQALKQWVSSFWLCKENENDCRPLQTLFFLALVFIPPIAAFSSWISAQDAFAATAFIGIGWGGAIAFHLLFYWVWKIYYFFTFKMKDTKDMKQYNFIKEDLGNNQYETLFKV